MAEVKLQSSRDNNVRSETESFPSDRHDSSLSSCSGLDPPAAGVKSSIDRTPEGWGGVKHDDITSDVIPAVRPRRRGPARGPFPTAGLLPLAFSPVRCEPGLCRA
ncbi:unnamed protein product [Gadus morhua 'NCC']